MIVKQIQLVAKQQVQSASKLMICADSYLQRFIKFPDIGIFHSYAELLHAALLESDNEVISFIPQPFKLMVNGRRYVPDCLVNYHDRSEVIELKPQGKFDDSMKLPLKDHFQNKYGMKFRVIPNESVFENELKACNWLFIIRTLCNSIDMKSGNQEKQLIKSFKHNPVQRLGDLVQLNNRITNCANELAIFRLIHQGKLEITHDVQIGVETKVKICI